jgi:dephospho-CoA kinase
MAQAPVRRRPYGLLRGRVPAVSSASATPTLPKTFKPAVRSIVARSLSRLVWAGAGAAAFWLLGTASRRLQTPVMIDPRWFDLGVWLMVAAAAGELAYQTLTWWSRTYSLGDRVLTSTWGILRRTSVSVPLTNVQQVVLDRTLAERIFGLGTICVTTAGSQTVDLAWVAIAHSHRRLEQVKNAVERARGLSPHVPVIGLAGGIGSGKSEVARILGDHNLLVIDADREAKEALDRPEVLGQLVQWWGKRVVDDTGRVDRKAVADIVFRDEGERRRLEALVHPIVRANRKSVIERAMREGLAGVVIDAPLLFESGSDADCDYIIFIDAPPAQRLARVKASRGWSAEEMHRRENAQIPLQEKRRRADIVIVNDADREALRERVREALGQMATMPPRQRACRSSGT